MATVRSLVGDAVGRVFCRNANVTKVINLTEHFSRIEIHGDELRGASCSPGDKVQIMFPEMNFRTYSPFSFDMIHGVMQFLVFAHSSASPGGLWGHTAAVGNKLRVFGPRSSLALSSLQGPIVLFGDETSFGVAQAVREYRGQQKQGIEQVHCVFEVNDRTESEKALAALHKTKSVVIERRGNGVAPTAHLPEATDEIRKILRANPQAHLVLTGNARSIQDVKKRLKEQGGLPASTLTKAYWAQGKKGLD